MSEQEKKWLRIYDLVNAETKPNKFFEIIGVSLWPPLSPDPKTLDYAIWGVLENKIKATSYPNIVSIKTTIKEKWNKLSKKNYFESMQIVFEACWCNNWKTKIAAILSKFIVLRLFSYFVFIFLNQN